LLFLFWFEDQVIGKSHQQLIYHYQFSLPDHFSKYIVALARGFQQSEVIV